MGLCTIKRSSEFQRVRGGRRAANGSFVIETRSRAMGTDTAASHGPRFGFTVTRKIGNAVVRNRIRRRLKEALRGLDPGIVQPGHDYVVVARSGVIGQPFDELCRLLAMTITGLHQPARLRTGGEDKRRPVSPPSRPKSRQR